LTIFKLPSPELKGQLSVEEAIGNRRSVREYSPQSLSLNDILELLWATQGITDAQDNLMNYLLCYYFLNRIF